MERGFVGVGKSGMNMVTRLQRGQHRVVAYDRTADLVKQGKSVDCVGMVSFGDLTGKLNPPGVVWVMMPSSAPADETIQKIAAFLKPVDIIIDGGNTNFHGDARRADKMKKRGIHCIDAGTCGGPRGLELGYCPNGLWLRGLFNA